MSMTRSLSELEGCVLGIVSQRQPCTPYAIRRELKRSPNPHWGKSAGAIYPVFERLEAAGLLTSRPHATGARQSLHYSTTASGHRALARWIGPPVDELTASLPMDPLRTRVGFLALLPRSSRQAFLVSAETQMRSQLAQVKQRAREDQDDPYEQLISEGAAAMLKARIAWLKRVQRKLA